MSTNAIYLAGMQLQMKKWDAEFEALVADGRKAGGEARTAYDRRLKELRLGRKSAQKSLEAVRDATGPAALKLQADMQATWEEMEKSLGKVSSDLKSMTPDGKAPPPPPPPPPAPPPAPGPAPAYPPPPHAPPA